MSSRWPKSGWSTPSCRCIAADVSPTLWPFSTAPSAVHEVTCASWIAYASVADRSGRAAVSGATGRRLAYAPSSVSAALAIDSSSMGSLHRFAGIASCDEGGFAQPAVPSDGTAFGGWPGCPALRQQCAAMTSAVCRSRETADGGRVSPVA